jgi:hypothetical protein
MYKLTNNSNVMLGSLVIPNDATNAKTGSNMMLGLPNGNTPRPCRSRWL